MDGQPAPDPIAWPWTDIKPTDFAFPADPNAFQLATHALTPAQVGATAVKDSRAASRVWSSRRRTARSSTRSRSDRSSPTRRSSQPAQTFVIHTQAGAPPSQ